MRTQKLNQPKGWFKMEIEQFKQKLKQAKKGTYHTAGIPLKVRGLRENQLRIEIPKPLHKTYSGSPTSIIVCFNKLTHLTIFEVGLLFYLFAYNKIPMDYGQYHECQAGKEFIENLREVII